MRSFTRFIIKRSANMVIVLFSTLILTVSLLGPTMDRILLDAIKFYVVEEVSHSSIKFQNTEERQNYIDQRIDLQIKTIGLDEPWYSPKRFTNTILRVMLLDLGKSNYLTSESGSANVRDIILEKMPKTLLLFTTSTLIITLIGLYLGAYVANRAGSVWDKLNSAFAVFSGSFPTWWVGMLMIFAFASDNNSGRGLWLVGLHCQIFCRRNSGRGLYTSQEGCRHIQQEDSIFSCSKECCAPYHHCRCLESCQFLWRCDNCGSSVWMARYGQLVLSGNRIL